MTGDRSGIPASLEVQSVEELRAELAAARARAAELERTNQALVAAGDGKVHAPDAKPTGVPRRRRRRAAVLLLLGTLLTPVSILAIFVNSQITDTDRFVQNVAPLSANIAVRSYVADVVTKQLFSHADVNRYIHNALPSQAQPLAGPLTGALQSFVRQAALEVLKSKHFSTVWTNANRTAHRQLVNVLTGEHGGAIAADSNGVVSVDLSAVAAEVKNRLDSTGIGLFSKIPTSIISGKITIFESKGLYKVRHALNILDTLAFVLPFAAVACFGAAIYLSPGRRRGYLSAAIGILVGALALALLLALGRSIYLNAATGKNLPHDAAAAVFDTLVRFLVTSVRAVLSFSIIVLIAVFAAGPSRFAVWFRTRVRESASWLGAQSDQAGWRCLAANAIVEAHKAGLRVVVAVVAFIAVFRWRHPTPGTVVSIAVLALLALGMIEFFGRELSTERAPTRA